jgi:hypothetical protein
MLKIILPETLIFEDDSELKTIRPSDKNALEVKSGSRSHSRVIELSDSESDDQKTYVTPLLLKKKRNLAPPPEETELEGEHSEIKQKLTRKKAPASVKSSTDKVR